jgi:hypothetical protein
MVEDKCVEKKSHDLTGRDPVMTKKSALTIIACFALLLFTLLLQGTRCEFRWMWLQVIATLALPSALTFLLFKWVWRIKQIWVKFVVIPLLMFGVLYLAFLYMWFGTSLDSKQYTFAPSGHNTVIVKEYHLNLLHMTHEFYRPVLFVLKQKIDAERCADEGPGQPLEKEGFIAKWNTGNSVCEISRNRWHLREAYIERSIVRFD